MAKYNQSKIARVISLLEKATGCKIKLVENNDLFELFRPILSGPWMQKIVERTMKPLVQQALDKGLKPSGDAIINEIVKRLMKELDYYYTVFQLGYEKKKLTSAEWNSIRGKVEAELRSNIFELVVENYGSAIEKANNSSVKYGEARNGNKILRFKDNTGQPCSLQMSSSAEDDLVWFGPGNDRTLLDLDGMNELLRLFGLFKENNSFSESILDHYGDEVEVYTDGADELIISMQEQGSMMSFSQSLVEELISHMQHFAGDTDALGYRDLY